MFFECGGVVPADGGADAAAEQVVVAAISQFSFDSGRSACSVIATEAVRELTGGGDAPAAARCDVRTIAGIVERGVALYTAHRGECAAAASAASAAGLSPGSPPPSTCSS